MPISPHIKMYAIAITLAVLSWDSSADAITAPVAASPATTISILQR